jgi:hypothetical protein
MPGKLEFFSSLELLGDPSSFLDYLAPLREAEWVVYAKRPFAGPGPVSVLVRKGHQVAESDNRAQRLRTTSTLASIPAHA